MLWAGKSGCGMKLGARTGAPRDLRLRQVSQGRGSVNGSRPVTSVPSSCTRANHFPFTPGHPIITSNRFNMDIAEDKFCLREVLVSFRSCLLDDDKDVLVEHYLNGWKGLVRFMNTLGTIFSFVSKDAVTKIQIMENYLKGDNGERYRTLQSMVEYELSSNLVDLTKRSGHPDSGCRTLLRLHRALRWLQLFLEKLRTSSEDSKTSSLCSEAYNDSLANYHPWLIRKTASVAFFALPARNTFFEVMNVGCPEEVVKMLGEALPYVSKVYDFTQELYAQHYLLDLP